MVLKRRFSTIIELKEMLQGYRLLFGQEPRIRITAHCFTGNDGRVIFNRLGQGYSVGHIGYVFITLVFADDGEDTKPFVFNPSLQSEDLYVIFE